MMTETVFNLGIIVSLLQGKCQTQRGTEYIQVEIVLHIV